MNLRSMFANDPDPEFSEALRTRIDPTLLGRLDRLVAFAKDSGHPKVTRSYVVRDALTAYLDGMEEEYPALRDG
jgi:predicted DNA-binding protein